MASQSESIDIRCPSCAEKVQAKWKCCPFCETRLESTSRESSTHIILQECLYSRESSTQFFPDTCTSIDFGSACIEKPVPEEQPIVSADYAMGSDSLVSTVKDCLREFEEAVQKGGVVGLGHINLDLNTWTQVQINIAVIGESGTGKSSFINAIRGLRPGDAFFAKTGSSQTTTAIQEYPHPEHHNLVFWDLPGVGTPRFPKETYLSVIDVKKYDFFILVSASRFKENDEWLAKEICRLEKNFYFVKSKIDFDVENDLRDSDDRLTKTDIIDKIRQNTTTELKKTDLTLPKLFLVNNKNIHEYDFKDLITQLINDVPVFKKDTLVLSLSSLATTVLDEKRQLLQKRVLPTAIKATIVNVLKGIQVCPVNIAGSIFNVDIGALVLEANFYQKQFGTNDQSLKIIASRINMSFDDLVHKLDIQSKSIVESARAFLLFFRMWEKMYKANMVLLAAPVSAIPLCMFVQRKILEMCYDEALKILDAQHTFISRKIMLTPKAGESSAK